MAGLLFYTTFVSLTNHFISDEKNVFIGISDAVFECFCL